MAISKYIVHAAYPEDMMNLLRDTRRYAFTVERWSDSDIFKSEDESTIGEDEILTALEWDESTYVDDHIFGSDVPVGGMVVLYDGHTTPHCGFVCGNGNDWIVIPVPQNVREKIVNDDVRTY